MVIVQHSSEIGNFDLEIYTKPDGTLIAIIGNSSNKMGKFSLMHLHLSLILLFPCVTQKEETNILPLGKDILNDLLAGTSWDDSNNTFACALVPNVFFTYFGQTLPTGCTTLDATKLAFELLGPGYAAWVNLATMLLQLMQTSKFFQYW